MACLRSLEHCMPGCNVTTPCCKCESLQHQEEHAPRKKLISRSPVGNMLLVM